MVAKEIASLQHPLVKMAVALRLEKEARLERNQVLVAGRKLIADLAPAWPLDLLFYSGQTPNVPAKETIRVTEEILKKIAGVSESNGWAAVAPLPAPQPLADKRYLLVLDRVADPGNLGALWRTALALGWEGIWLTPGCVDPFNDKALRAARGATFRLPYEWMAPEALTAWGGTLWTADMGGAPLSACRFAAPLALILGHEGQGAGEWTQPLSKVSIPMDPRVESLNVASAGAILLYAMRGR